jgi:hypothetical protein
MEEFVILGLILYLMGNRSHVHLIPPEGFELYGGTLTPTTRTLMYTNTSGRYVYATVRNEGVINSIIVYHIIDGVEAYSSEIKAGQSKKIMMNIDNKLYGSSFMTGFNVDYSLSIQNV